MRMTAIALLGSFLLLPAALPASACPGAKLTMAQAAATEMSAAAAKKKAPKKMQKEKVEYMRSAAPPEPKK